MQSDSLAELPSRLVISEVVSSRYSSNVRPENWDERMPGNDIVKTTDGQTIKLQSDGGQSPPKKNWEILVTKGNPESGYSWTLYAIK